MKANEAPEKIYMNPSFWEPENVSIVHFSNSQFDYNIGIEYTRTDAFIEKAEKFFTEKFEVEDYNDNIDIDGWPIFNYGRFIEDFKKYMED